MSNTRREYRTREQGRWNVEVVAEKRLAGILKEMNKETKPQRYEYLAIGVASCKILMKKIV